MGARDRKSQVSSGISLTAVIGAGLALAAFTAPALAQDTVHMISHRYPALEYYAERMKEAVPGVEVDTQLMPHDRAMELANIAMSSQADTIDILYLNDSTFLTFAKNGWLLPMNDLWAQYTEEFGLDDIPQSVIDTFTYDGNIYVMPHTMNTQMFFYRKDLFDEAGVSPPTTFEEYLALAEQFNSPLRAGTISCQKPVDAALNETHWYISALGDGWFDEDMRPIFNDAAGVAAIDMLDAVTDNAQPGFTSAANDECTIALQQDTAVMGMQWATRAAAMDDPDKSNVVGLIDWVAPPQGHHRIAADGYAISAFSSQDADLLFRIIATSANQENMRGAAAMILPPRASLLNDPELAANNRHYPAALASLEVGEAFPRLPEFYEVGEFITRRVLQALTGEMSVQDALDAAAKETEELLVTRGYYQ